MRKTLRRSCDTCARSKLRCDLLIPRCTRCAKKGLECVYANEPLSSISDSNATIKEDSAIALMPTTGRSPFKNEPGIQSLDPFDSLPRTRLPRAQVQQLIQHFLSSISFQYYPLDLDAASNPFVVSWWPLALADPALFHVSLQTASLDIDLRSQRGFATSDILMADSVALVRSKIEDPLCAAQDETLDSVVTLAAIEFGKGNVDVSNMHIDGVKSMVRLRGGIENVKKQNPLTARMVSWVSLVLSQSPQFATQDDFGFGVGLDPPAQWLEPGSSIDASLYTHGIMKDLDPDIQNIISRLASIFRHATLVPLSTTELHDLTCFVLHRLLSWSPRSMSHTATESVTSECIRSALVLYMLILHGPTYFSHALLQQKSVSTLRSQFEILLRSGQQHSALTVWLLSVGLVASDGLLGSEWFSGCAVPLTSSLGLQRWSVIRAHLQQLLWLDDSKMEFVFKRRWEEIIGAGPG